MLPGIELSNGVSVIIIIVPNHDIIIIIIPLSIELSNGVSVSTLLYPVSLLFGWWSIFHLVELSNGVSVIIVPNHYHRPKSPSSSHHHHHLSIIIYPHEDRDVFSNFSTNLIIIISIWGDWQPWRWSALDNKDRSACWLHWSVFTVCTCTLYTYKQWEFQTKTSLRITENDRDIKILISMVWLHLYNISIILKTTLC